MCSTLGVGALALVTRVADAAAVARQASADAAAGRFALAPLPYPAAALEPHIDARTMQLHHGHHHQAYVENLNLALAAAGAAATLPLDELLKHLDQVPAQARSAVRNNGGGHANHAQFWTVLAPNAGGVPSGAIADALASSFGSVDGFKELFAAAAAAHNGSGWVWLSDDRGRLVIHSTANQDTPSMEDKHAIFGLDLWEHAYYLEHQHRRTDYIAAFWHVINWDEANRRLRG